MAALLGNMAHYHTLKIVEKNLTFFDGEVRIMKIKL